MELGNSFDPVTFRSKSRSPDTKIQKNFPTPFLVFPGHVSINHVDCLFCVSKILENKNAAFLMSASRDTGLSEFQNTETKPNSRQNEVALI